MVLRCFEDTVYTSLVPLSNEDRTYLRYPPVIQPGTNPHGLPEVPGGMHFHHESQSPSGCFGHLLYPYIIIYIYISFIFILFIIIYIYYINHPFVRCPWCLAPPWQQALRQLSRSSHEPHRSSLMRWSGGWWWPPAIAAWAPTQRPWSYMKISTNRIPMTLSAWDIWSPFARTARFAALGDFLWF